MHFISLRTKFIFISILALILVVMQASRGLDAISQVKEIAKLSEIVTLTKLQMRIDMMHDAINGNVNTGVNISNSVKLGSHKAELEELSKNLEENIKTAEESFVALKELELPEEFQQDFVMLDKEFVAYIQQSRKTIGDFMTNPEKANEIYKNDFFPVFDKLVGIQEKLADMVDNHAKTTSETAINSAEDNKKILEYSALISVLISLFLPIYAYFAMFRPQRKLLDIADCLSGGDVGVCEEIPHGNRQDEVGALAKTLIILRDNLKRQGQIASDFENKVKRVVDIVASAATEMEATARSMKKDASENQETLGKLSIGVSDTVENIQHTSAAIEQIYSSMNEISKQVQSASKINSEAVVEAETVAGLGEGLSVAASKVNEINSIITSIAGKINLLSLNATIEAARAGEAGKGFAVVASEVKLLAEQTATSANQITAHIQSIQQSSADTLGGVKSIGTVISQINNISSTIASAIEEQGTGTRDISKNIKEAADRSESVSSNVLQAANSAKLVGDSADEMLGAASELSHQAEILRSDVDAFLRGMRGIK